MHSGYKMYAMGLYFKPGYQPANHFETYRILRFEDTIGIARYLISHGDRIERIDFISLKVD